jgi:tetratricopeptide (TPR) repeat protein
MSLAPRENNVPLSKFESMLKTNSIYFFDSIEFEQIIHFYIDSAKNNLAKKAIDLGLKQHPNASVLRLLSVELMIFDGEFEKAHLLLNEIRAIEPSNAEVYVQQASIYSKKNEHFKAIESLKIALNCTDDEADIFSMIGMEFLYLDNFTEARLNFSKCLDLDFEDYSALYNLIYCYDMQKLHKEAAEYLNVYLDRDPYCEIVWHQLGRQYFILENFEEAVRAFDFAVLIDEYFVGAYLEKAKSFEQLEKYEDAIENYKITLELDDPASSYALLRIGECYNELNDTDSAISYFKKALHEDPLLDKGWYALSNLNFDLGKYLKALYYVKKAIEIDEQNKYYWRGYAQIHLRLNLFEEVVSAFEKCIELEDFDLEIWLGLCDVQCYLGDYDDAIVNLMKAKKWHLDIVEIEFRLGGLYLLIENFEEGFSHLRKALGLNFKAQAILKEYFPRVFKMKEVKEIINEFK